MDNNPLFPNSDSTGLDRDIEYAMFIDDTDEMLEDDND